MYGNGVGILLIAKTTYGISVVVLGTTAPAAVASIATVPSTLMASPVT